MRRSTVCMVFWVLYSVVGHATEMSVEEKGILPSPTANLSQTTFMAEATFMDDNGCSVPVFSLADKPINYVVTRLPQNFMVLALYNSAEKMGGLACLEKQKPSLNTASFFFNQVKDKSDVSNLKAYLYYHQPQGRDILLTFLQEKGIACVDVYNGIKASDNILALNTNSGEFFSAFVSEPFSYQDAQNFNYSVGGHCTVL